MQALEYWRGSAWHQELISQPSLEDKHAYLSCLLLHFVDVHVTWSDAEMRRQADTDLVALCSLAGFRLAGNCSEQDTKQDVIIARKQPGTELRRPCKTIYY